MINEDAGPRTSQRGNTLSTVDMTKVREKKGTHEKLANFMLKLHSVCKHSNTFFHCVSTSILICETYVFLIKKKKKTIKNPNGLQRHQ